MGLVGGKVMGWMVRVDGGMGREREKRERKRKREREVERRQSGERERG